MEVENISSAESSEYNSLSNRSPQKAFEEDETLFYVTVSEQEAISQVMRLSPELICTLRLETFIVYIGQELEAGTSLLQLCLMFDRFKLANILAPFHQSSIQDQAGQTSLHWAIWKQQFQIVQYLLQEANVIAQEFKIGKFDLLKNISPLGLYCIVQAKQQLYFPEILRQLIVDQGIPFQWQAKTITPTGQIVIRNQICFSIQFITDEYQQDILQIDRLFQLAYINQLTLSHCQTFQITNLINHQKESLLHVASYGNAIDSVMMLSQYFTALIGQVNNQDETALDVAIKRGNLDIVEYLWFYRAEKRQRLQVQYLGVKLAGIIV